MSATPDTHCAPCDYGDCVEHGFYGVLATLTDEEEARFIVASTLA